MCSRHTLILRERVIAYPRGGSQSNSAGIVTSGTFVEVLVSIEESPTYAERPTGRWCPLEEAGILSRLTFSFCNQLISLGLLSPLQLATLWDLPRAFEADKVWQELVDQLQTTRDPVKQPQVLLLLPTSMC